jgi:hypothetical protein
MMQAERYSEQLAKAQSQCQLKRAIAVSMTLLLFAANLFAAPPRDDKKLKPEEVIARHLEAIGSAEARNAVKWRTVSGTVNLTLRLGGAGNLAGEAMMVSTGSRFRYGMKFRSNDYPGEDMAFDGSQVDAGFLPKGGRSQISAFLTQEPTMLREGLLGGVLSTAWALLRLDEQQPRLEYHGLKKIDGRELYEMMYRPRKGGSSLKITLYFDPTTFQHVRTKYFFQIAASIGTKDSPVQNPESYMTLTEDFEDFRAVDGLTLPHKYRLQLSVQSTKGSAIYDYTLTASQIVHNQAFQEGIFKLK